VKNPSRKGSYGEKHPLCDRRPETLSGVKHSGFEDNRMNEDKHPDLQKARGALFGMCIGDALAMPVHWYYDRSALLRDYGRVTDFLSPRKDHPHSILWRSDYRALNVKGEILHDQAKYWGQKNVHYHQFLKAGENTLNIKISRLLMDSLMENSGYVSTDFLQRYIAFMTTPGSHRDTY
jgi:ADP-ribosyl-[dinitrogen reductase] hydrolase